MKEFLVAAVVAAEVGDDASEEQMRVAITTALGGAATPLTSLPMLPADTVACHERAAPILQFCLQLALQLVPELAGAVALPFWRLRSPDLPAEVAVVDPTMHADAMRLVFLHALLAAADRHVDETINTVTELRRRLDALAASTSKGAT